MKYYGEISKEIKRNINNIKLQYLISDNNDNFYEEIYDIINHLDDNLYRKIPQNFIKHIENNLDNSKKVNIDYTKSLNKQKLCKNTRIMLSLIYRNYFKK